MLLFQTHSLSISHNKDSPVSRSNLERIPTQGKVMMCTLLICRRAQKALSWPLFMEENNWLTLIFAYWLQNLVSPTLGLSQTLTSTIFGGGEGELLRLILGYCVVIYELDPSWPDTSLMPITHGYHLSVVMGKKGCGRIQDRICSPSLSGL